MATIYRIPDVMSATGRSRSGLYVDISSKLLPAPVKLSARAVGWPSDEISAVVSARIAGKTETEIRALVARLEAARKQAA